MLLNICKLNVFLEKRASNYSILYQLSTDGLCLMIK